MKTLIVGCGWVGTYVAAKLLEEGHEVWGTCTSEAKANQLTQLGVISKVVDFDKMDTDEYLETTEFDGVIVSVPITRKDSSDVVGHRFRRLCAFLERLSCKQSIFFGSVGIYPKVSAVITEDTFLDQDLDPKLLSGEIQLRSVLPDINILRLGGLFGFDRVMAKHFAGRICEIGYQTANFVHLIDIYGIIRSMMKADTQGRVYNVVCPEHPLKKEVIQVSAAKYGYGLPTGFSDVDKTAKIVSPERVITELGYQFMFPSPLGF